MPIDPNNTRIFVDESGLQFFFNLPKTFKLATLDDFYVVKVVKEGEKYKKKNYFRINRVFVAQNACTDKKFYIYTTSKTMDMDNLKNSIKHKMIFVKNDPKQS
jgi:hypothetical protein